MRCTRSSIAGSQLPVNKPLTSGPPAGHCSKALTGPPISPPLKTCWPAPVSKLAHKPAGTCGSRNTLKARSPAPSIKLPTLKPRLATPFSALSVPKTAFSNPTVLLSSDMVERELIAHQIGVEPDLCVLHLGEQVADGLAGTACTALDSAPANDPAFDLISWMNCEWNCAAWVLGAARTSSWAPRRSAMIVDTGRRPPVTHPVVAPVATKLASLSGRKTKGPF